MGKTPSTDPEARDRLDTGASPPRRFPTPCGVRWEAARGFLALGAIGIVGGGIVAAVTGPTDFEHGSWMAAYLVLVVGVAQMVLGAGLAWLPEALGTRGANALMLVGWNVAAAAVVVGTLVSAPVLTSVGGVLTVVGLIGFVVAVAHARTEFSGWALLYRALVAFVLLSTPVGLLLAWIRRG